LRGLSNTLSIKEWFVSSELDCVHFSGDLAMVRRRLRCVSHFDRLRTGLALAALLAKAELAHV
jgi:hypothetical protein